MLCVLCCADAEEGGETAFPHSRWLDKEKQTAGVEFSECAKAGVAALPRKGNAVLFWDTKVGSMRQDKWSMHAGERRRRPARGLGTELRDLWVHMGAVRLPSSLSVYSSLAISLLLLLPGLP